MQSYCFHYAYFSTERAAPTYEDFIVKQRSHITNSHRMIYSNYANILKNLLKPTNTGSLSQKLN